ncbi:MAG: MBL fold metallo-hydrolase [Spirochaetes bacterium]|nr:MBL fold metallo-hydrolase [Spirochaetota bacterium]MBU1080151.1 MBL fold metallo-hydrolase [Spirochaetota bacterium]
MAKTVHRLAEGAYHIHESLDVFCSLVVGSRAALLIDTGYGFGDIRGAVAGITDLPILVLNTHGHVDHVHGNSGFPEVMIHRADERLMRKHSSPPFRLAIYAMCRAQLSREERSRRRRFLEPDGSRVRLIDDGHVIDLGGASVEVIWTPGHTGGSVCALDVRDRILFSGDSLSSHTWLFLKESTSVAAYAASVRKVMARASEFDEIVSSHSAARFRPSLLGTILKCAENLEPARSAPYDSRLAGKALLYTEGFERVTERYGYADFDEFMRHARDIPPEAIAEMGFASIAYRRAKLRA